MKTKRKNKILWIIPIIILVCIGGIFLLNTYKRAPKEKYVFGDEAVLSNTQKEVRIKYIRQDKNYKGWNVWTWFTGVKDGAVLFKEQEGFATASFKIANDASKVGFIIRKGEWEQKDIESDRYIDIDPKQTITKVILNSNQEEIHIVPYINGPKLEGGNITFYFRDEALYRQDKLQSLESVQIKINGKKENMEYDEENEVYFYTLKNPTEENYLYTFLVKQNNKVIEILDPHQSSTKDKKSFVEFKKPKVEIDTKVEPSAISYNENAVVSIDVESQEVEVKDIYMDLTSLGGEKNYKVDSELKSATIYVEEEIPAGTKKIPVLVMDQYGNQHQGEITIEVKARQFAGKDDFDWDEARIYFMLTDRFFDGDPSNNNPNNENYDKSHMETYHGGDFKGITQKIGYLSDLGINTIWITPIVDNIDFNKGVDFNSFQYGYHGYWAQDFTKIDEHLGSLEDFKELIDVAHDKGIKIMVDVVLNHTGYGMKPGEEAKWGHLSNFPSEEVRKKLENMLRDGGSDVIKGELAGLPDFITEDPKVRKQIIQWQTDWIEKTRTDKGNTIDYFRVDTVKHVEKTTWKDFKNQLTKIKPDFKIIGEHFGASVNNIGGNLKSGQMDSLLDFEFKEKAKDFVNGRIDSAEEALLKRNEKITSNAMMGQFLSSHDEDGFLYQLGNDLSKFKAAVALQITAKGQPVIYYGEELGATGKNAGNMGNGEFSENRYDMPWGNVNNSIHSHYQKLLHIRKKYSKVFSKGTREKIGGSNEEKYTVFERKYKDQSIIVAINTEEKQKEIKIKVPFEKDTILIEEYSQKTYKVNDTKEITISLPSTKDGGTIILSQQ